MNKAGNVRVFNIETFTCYHCSTGRAIVITYSVCVFVALGNRDAKRMRHIILSSVAFLTYHIFSPLSNKRPDIQVNVFEHKIYTFIALQFCLKKNPHSKKNSER